MTFNRFSDPLLYLEAKGINPAPMESDDAYTNTTSGPKTTTTNTSTVPSPEFSAGKTVANTANRRVTMTNNKLIGEGHMDSRFKKAINEFMDIHDYSTSKRLYALDEAEQNSLLLSLTDKLYKMIVGKIDEISFGDIPNTRGDVTRLPKYDQMRECIDVIKGIFEQYREDIKPVMVIDNALSNIENHKDLFMQCYGLKIDLGMIIYNTMTLSVINSLSYMIAVCIEYIKDPKNDGMKVVLDKTGVAKVKDHLVYENLEKFNDSCRVGDIENSLRPLIKNRAKGFAFSLIGVKSVLILGGVLLAIIPMLRDLVYFFFAARSRVSNYFEIQADLLDMNANELKDNPDIKTEGDRDSVIRRQLTIARMFHKLADKIAVEAKTSERMANQEIKADTKKYKIDDVSTDPVTSEGPLF